MRNVFAILGLFFLTTSSFANQDEKKKEPVYTVISTKYVLTSTIIDDFFRAAKSQHTHITKRK